MKSKKLALALALIMVLSSFALVACGGGEAEDEGSAERELGMYKDFVEAVDTEYAYNIALELSENTDFHDSELGSRLSGSDAEHAAADWLVEQMNELGLQDVEKVGVDVDKWQFNGASILIEGDDNDIQLHSYATAATPTEGITAEVVFVGEGTAADYEELDVEGKIVLFDVNQRDNWWVTYPMLEAEHQGAVAALACSREGFSEVSTKAYNSNDICGPTSIPTTSITADDADYILEKLEGGEPVTATMKVDNIVEEGGTSYNVMGKIPGKNSDEMIIFGGHYDMYYSGFQDDSCAIGGALAIAKAMLDSGYTPERDILFVAHGAEEWGASYTQFDWTTGAWRMINEAHPEWAGKTLSFINFELPAYEFGDYTSMYSAPEMYTMIDRFVNEEPSPGPVNCFKEGVKTEGYQTYTYSDDFSYYVAGVPSTVNGFLLQEDMETVFPFYKEYYHTNFDTKDTYNEDVMRFTIEFYGSFGIYIDSTPALQLDYTSQYDRLTAAIDEEAAEANEVDLEGYKAAVEEYKTAAEGAFAKVEDINARYAEAVENEASEDEIAAIWAEAREANAFTLAHFKETQDLLLGLMYERPIVPHEAPQENINLMNEIVPLLEEGDGVTAADEYAWQVNNVEQWYEMYFSPEVTSQFTDMFYGADNQDNLFWGTNKAYTPADVAAATRGLMDKYEEEGADFSAEIGIYNKAIEAQQAVYKELITKEITDVKALAAKLAEFAG